MFRPSAGLGRPSLGQIACAGSSTLTTSPEAWRPELRLDSRDLMFSSGLGLWLRCSLSLNAPEEWKEQILSSWRLEEPEAEDGEDGVFWFEGLGLQGSEGGARDVDLQGESMLGAGSTWSSQSSFCPTLHALERLELRRHEKRRAHQIDFFAPKARAA